jgi:hypothetical protein
VEFKENEKMYDKFNMICFRNKSRILIQARQELIFGDLGLDTNLSYYQDGTKLNDRSKMLKGDNWIEYRSVLSGGSPKYPDVQIKFFVIYTSMNKLIKFEKVDLIGYDEDMDDWLLTAIDYKTDCGVTICEVEHVGKTTFWIDTYQVLKDDCELKEWMWFF